MNLKYIDTNIYNTKFIPQRTTYIDEKRIEINDRQFIVPCIKYNIFKKYENKDIIHGFSTRLGGVSKDHLSSMNLSFQRGDSAQNVLFNHSIFAKALGYNYKNLVFSDQIHDKKIKAVKINDAGKGITKESDIIGIDGLCTNISGIPLITFYADCVPLFFYDPQNKAIGLAHSGWRGTVSNIAREMIKTMNNEYGTEARDLICAIGPSICQECYEVSEDVYVEFKEKYSQDEIKEIIYDKSNGKYQLNLHNACKYNLINEGVGEDSIALPDLCTCHNNNYLFSHRASSGKRGNLAAVMMLK